MTVASGRTGVRPGDRIGLSVEAGAVHLFDPATGRSLAAAGT